MPPILAGHGDLGSMAPLALAMAEQLDEPARTAGRSQPAGGRYGHLLQLLAAATAPPAILREGAPSAGHDD